MMLKETLFASAMSSLMLPVVSMTKHSTEDWERPINLQGFKRQYLFTACLHHQLDFGTKNLLVMYRRKFLSPIADLMSSRSSTVAFTAKSAASWCSEPWLDPFWSLLMPPTGSRLLVWSKEPPWLHLP